MSVFCLFAYDTLFFKRFTPFLNFEVLHKYPSITECVRFPVLGIFQLYQ